MAKKDKNNLLNIHYSRTMTSDNLSKAANYVGKYVLKGLGAFGKIMTAPFVSQGPTSATIYKSKELLAKERTIKNKSEELLGKAMTWVSPLNYGVALTTGNGLNARKGEEEVASWSPAWLAVGRLGELYVGPKAIKGVKAAPKAVVNTAAKAGVKPAKAAVVAREIKLATKNKPNLSNRTVSSERSVNGITGVPEVQYTLYNEFGEPIGLTNIGGAALGHINRVSKTSNRMVDGIYSKNKAHKVSEDTYNVAVEDILNNGGVGLESGWSLMSPEKTMATTSKFPYLVIGHEFGNPVRLLTGTTKRPIPQRVQGNHYIEIKPKTTIEFDEISGEFKEVPIKENIQEPITSLKFFERKPSKISKAERAGVPKGERFKNKKHYTGIGRNYRGTIFGEENIPKDIEYVEPITSGKKFGESDYSFENRKYATKQYLKELNNRDSGIFSDKGVESIKKYISLLPDDLNPNFINTNGLLSFYIRDFRLYLNDLGYRAGDLTDTEIAKLLTNLYDILSKTLTGKLKGKVVFHSGPNFFDLFDFAHTGETMGNMGYLGPGNYFSTKPSVYGGKGNYTTQDLIGQYRYPRRLPYLINNIKSTPVSGELKRAKIIPEYTSPPRETYGDTSAKNNYILLVILPLVKSTKVRDMAVLDDISVSPHSLYTNGVQTEFMVPRNTGIKSLYPHPSLFIEDANGKITLNRNWDDIRVNYKQGGKMNIIKLFKEGGQIRKMQTAAGGPLINESTRVEKPIIITPKKINKTPLLDDNLWEKTDNSKANVYPNLRNDKYVQEFFLYDYAPRFKRLNNFASKDYVNAALSIYKNTPISIYNEDNNVGGYKTGGEREVYNNYFSNLVNLHRPLSIYLNEKFKLNRPTLVHELTHAFRLGYLGITGDARFSSAKYPIYNRINKEIGNEYYGSGYTNAEKDKLNKAYNMNGYKINYDPLYEKGTTNTEVRFRLWKELYDKLGRRPTLEETDKFIKGYDSNRLGKTIKNANGYGLQMYENGIDINDAKDALINVAQNNSNNTYLLDDQTYYAKQGGILEFLKNGGQVRKMLTASGGPLRIKFTPEEIALFESQATRIPGMNNSRGNRYREEGVLALLYLEQEAKRKEEEIKSRMEMRPTLKRRATFSEKLRGKKDEYVPTTQIVGMSGADPLLSFYVGGVGLNGIGALAKTGLWNIAKYAPTTLLGNWGRGYFIGNTFKNSFNGTKNLSELLAFDLFQELTSAPTSKITKLRPEFSLAMQDKNYVFGRLLWSTNLTKDGYTTPQTKHIKVMDTEPTSPLIYVSLFLYPLSINNGGLKAIKGGSSRPIWLNSNKPYFGTPTGESNSTNYTYIIDANKFTPELNLLRNIGGAHYEYPGTIQLPIEGTKRILWDPVLQQYTSTIFTDASKLGSYNKVVQEPPTSLKFFERNPSKSVTKEYVQSPKDITSDVGDLIAEGSERSVYASKSNPNIVYKIEDGNAPLEDINNIKIRSEINDDIIAPETTIGYYKHKNGKYYRVTQQDKYKSYDPDNFYEEVSPELNLEIIKTLEKAGWKVNIEDGHATTASKNGITIGNLEHFNWGRDSNGNLKLIDLYVYSLKQGGKMNKLIKMLLGGLFKLTDYIKAIENPDSIGWNGRVWAAPTLKGYDKNQRGFGIDVNTNKEARALTEGRPGRWLTDREANTLMNNHINYITKAANKHIKGFSKLSPKRQAALLGMLYRGDSVNKSGINIYEPNDHKFFKSISNYYRSKGLNTRADNSDKFFNISSKLKMGGQIRKMEGAGKLLPFSEKQALDRHNEIAKQYFSSTPTISNLYNGAINWLKGHKILLPDGTSLLIGHPPIIPGKLGSSSFELSKNASQGERIWKYLFDYVKKNPKVVEQSKTIPLGYTKGTEYTLEAKLPLEGLSVRNNTPLTLENRAMNPAEKAAAEDYLSTVSRKINEEFPDVYVNTKLPTGRPSGEFRYPKEILEKYGFGKSKTTVKSNNVTRNTNIENAKLSLTERYHDRKNYSRKEITLDKNNRAYETGKATPVNSGQSRVKIRLLENVSSNITKYPKHEQRALDKLKLKLAKKGLSRKEIERHKDIKAFYRRLADQYGYFKNGGLLEFLKNGSGIHIKKKNRGKFTEYCGGKVTQECIRKAKASGNPTLVKRATFADNARHFKHLLGGNLAFSNPNAFGGVFENVLLGRLRDLELQYYRKKLKEQQALIDLLLEQLKSDVISNILGTAVNTGLNYLLKSKQEKAT